LSSSAPRSPCDPSAPTRPILRGKSARDLGLHENVLRKWVRDTKAHGAQAFAGQGRMRIEADFASFVQRHVWAKSLENRLIAMGGR